MQKEIAGVMRQISSAVAFLPLLSDPCECCVCSGLLASTWHGQGAVRRMEQLKLWQQAWLNSRRGWCNDRQYCLSSGVGC